MTSLALLWLSTPNGRCPDCGHPLAIHRPRGLCEDCAMLEAITDEIGEPCA